MTRAAIVAVLALSLAACRGDARQPPPAPEQPARPAIADEAARIHREVEALATRYREVTSRRDQALGAEANDTVATKYPPLRRKRMQLALDLAEVMARIENKDGTPDLGSGAAYVRDQELLRARELLDADKRTLDDIQRGLNMF